MNMIKIPDSYNYCSAFLTFACTYNCSYCINKYNGLYKYKHLPVEDWIKGLNRIEAKKNLPITLTGGEPTIYPDFYKLVAGIDTNINIDLLTNGDFEVLDFINNIPADRMKRDAKYASIRFSFHPQDTDYKKLLWLVYVMQKCEYSVGIWAVDTGDEIIQVCKEAAKIMGIDFRIKEFLDETHGNYKYPKAVDGKRKKCLCKPSELLIAPDGRLFRCHYDLYHGVNSYGHILDPDVRIPQDFLPCDNYGLCNPCDIKSKFNRFQEKNWCSVTIKEVDNM